MSDPDDPLSGPLTGPLTEIDLDAWQPPTPPGGLADAVLRRMREPVAVPAHELAEPPGEAPGARRGRRGRLWLGAGAVVAAAAAGALVVAPWRAAAPPVDRGDVVADRASHVELGASAAELDAGAALSWRREHWRISVAQLRGAATWRVGGEDTMVIDAGAMGASVEASGASLRVEVAMRITPTDGRVVAASTITAAAVALVTVVVYQGHVKITSGGQTVNVGAGGAVEIKPGEPARELRAVAAVPDSVHDRVYDPGQDPDEPTGAAGIPRTPAPPAAVPPGALPRTAKPGEPPPAPRPPAAALDAPMIDLALSGATEVIANCLAGQRLHVTASVAVNPDGRVDSVEVKPVAVPSACVASALRNVKFDVTQSGGKFERSFDGDPDEVPTRNIAPNALEPLRIKGNKTIMPDSFVQRSIQNTGDNRLIAVVKLCIDTTGKVSRLTLLKTSGYPAYDDKILAEMKGWGYRPYVADGKPVTVCTAVTFIYSQH
jgi:ferric-dicitrate binding protein FerR (iron transport regulator)